MKTLPSTILRCLVALIGIALVRPAAAHDWPFQVDLTGRGINVMRQVVSATEPAAAEYAKKPQLKWSEAFKLFEAAKQLDYVQLLPKVAPQREATINYAAIVNPLRSALQFSALTPLRPSHNNLIVHAALDQPAPVPAQATLAAKRQEPVLAEIGYSEHCFGPAYLPYDYQATRPQSAEVHYLTQEQTEAAVDFVADLHCRVSDELVRGEFARDLGQGLASGIRYMGGRLESGLAAAAAGWNGDLKNALPKYAYLSSRSGMVLAPIELAERWGSADAGVELSPKSLELIQEVTSSVRSRIASTLDNIGGSFLYLSSQLAPSAHRVASDSDYPNPLR